MAMILQFQESSILQSILQQIDARLFYAFWSQFAPPNICIDVAKSTWIAQYSFA